MTCQDREKQLPAYLEGELSPAEAEEFRVHLASCTSCRKTLEDMKKTDRLVQGLAEVEPPPWLKQQIMARVRQEASEKKGFLQRVFFPLYIKIPVQAFAVIIISVLAFYVYRQDAPQMRIKGSSLPPAAVFEVKKDRTPQQTDVLRRKTSAPSGDIEPRERTMTNPEMSQAEHGDVPVPSESLKKEGYAAQYGSDQEVLENEMQSAPVLSEQSPGSQSDGNVLIPARKDKSAERSLPQAVGQSRMCEQDACLAKEKGAGAAVGLSAAPDGMLKDARQSLELALTVKDVASAVAELEKIAEESQARYMEMTVQENKQVFTTELRPPFVGPFLEKLHVIGQPGEYVRPEMTKDTQWVKIKISIMASFDHKP
jgi:hypothetical protein